MSVSFVRGSAILRSDIRSTLVADGGQMHFILGVDEYGQKITQDLIPYVMDSLVGGLSNAYNIEVNKLLRS